jgi:hypothetical protein
MSQPVVTPSFQQSIDAIIAMEAEAHVLAPTLEERARQLASVCRTAAAIDWNRRRAGLPEPQPDPWPASTWEFLAKHARRHQ